ncbi:Anthrax Toxin Receptor-Like [Manis pentadactyla]|nr:Anthrax Toxin Receptor-Like [Manis pentadactyla]
MRRSTARGGGERRREQAAAASARWGAASMACGGFGGGGVAGGRELVATNAQIREMNAVGDAPRLIIALTDGKLLPVPFAETVVEAAESKLLGATLYFVGMEGSQKDQLLKIAGKRGHVFSVNNGFSGPEAIFNRGRFVDISLNNGVSYIRSGTKIWGKNCVTSGDKLITLSGVQMLTQETHVCVQLPTSMKRNASPPTLMTPHQGALPCDPGICHKFILRSLWLASLGSVLYKEMVPPRVSIAEKEGALCMMTLSYLHPRAEMDLYRQQCRIRCAVLRAVVGGSRGLQCYFPEYLLCLG